MSKFNGKNMLGTFGTWALNGLTEVGFSSDADVVEQAISGQTYKAQIVGVPNASFSINALLDNDSPAPATFMTALTPGNTGTFTFDSDSTSTYGPTFSGIGQVRSRSISFPVENFVAYTLEIAIDGALTIS